MTSISARVAVDGDDLDAVSRALRHDLRWQRVGLAEAPDHFTLTEPAAVAWPARGTRRVQAVLLFAGDQLVGLGTHFGWGDDLDRTRIAELVLLGAADGKAAADALVSLLFASALALRVRLGGSLATLVPGGPEVTTFKHLARPKSVAVVSEAKSRIDAGTLRRLGAYGSGRVDAAERERAELPVPQVLDPSSAHADLLRSSKLLARRYFPARSEVVDLDVAIVGGGIAGLTAAHALAPRATTLFEREAVIGGTARAGSAAVSRFPLGAHYECDPDPSFSPEVLALYERLGLTRCDAKGHHTFVDERHYVPPEDYEQSVLANGQSRRRGWRMFFADPAGAAARHTLLGVKERFTVPTRLSSPEARSLDQTTFAAWLAAHGVTLPFDLAHGLDVLLRSDYAAPAAGISAYAGLHYFLCRPYLKRGSRTFSPPEGLAYFAERLLERTPTVAVEARHMVRRVEAFADHVRLDVLDLEGQKLRSYRAQAVVYASPKKSVKWIHPPDAALFAGNAYAAWLTVTFELECFPESAQLCWNNHVYDPRPEHIGFTWVNHRDREAPPVLTHYIAYEPGRWQHARALYADKRAIVRRCADHISTIVGRDVSSLVKRVTVQLLGHAMAVPLPGKLFFDPNARRVSERVVYAGVDTGRLPIVAEAFDSGLEAARIIGAL